MRILKFILCASFLALLHCSGADKASLLEYSIRPTVTDSTVMLQVQMTCKAGLNGETKLLFLNDSWGEADLHNCLHSLRSLDESSEVEVQKDSGWIIIKHPVDIKNVHLEYVLKQDTSGELTTEKAYRPIIQQNYFHVFSHSLFMIPLNYSEDKAAKFDVDIYWKDFPEAYRLQNSFGTNQREQHIEGTSEELFNQSVFLGGDYRSYTLNIKDNDVVFSTRGQWKTFQDSTMLNVLRQTITAQRDFWQDHSQPYFSVNLTPTVQDRGSSFQGTGLTNSFNCTASNNEYLELEGLVYLFNHELQHNWTGHLIKNANEEEQYWFSEGFTDYYTNKTIARHNIHNLDKSYFITKINEIIRLLYTSPVKEAPNSEINYDNFWKSRDFEKLPYRRGALLAFILDYTIYKDSNGQQSLDDLMLSIKEDAIKSDQRISHDYFIKKVNQYVEKDFSEFFKRHIEEGQLFDLEAIFNDLDLAFIPKAKVFDLGFEFSEDKTAIMSVDESSEAYAKGMRAGDKLRSRSYYHGSPDYLAEFIVVRDGKDVPIAYYPAKDADIPQLLDTVENHERLNF